MRQKNLSKRQQNKQPKKNTLVGSTCKDINGTPIINRQEVLMEYMNSP